jgi:hypothetical protein
MLQKEHALPGPEQATLDAMLEAAIDGKAA